jgi:glycosyltransferase A (GT-A) superfamily protein (DUF2064 family)
LLGDAARLLPASHDIVVLGPSADGGYYLLGTKRLYPKLCCIAPFSQRDYEHCTLGDATQQSLRETWNGPAYQKFRSALLSEAPPHACANCGLRWSL